jgi:hypothetical protein
MVNNTKRHALSLLIAAGGCVAGAYSAYAAFSNGVLITDGIAGTMFGLAFAAVVIISWIMLPWADRRAEEGYRRDAWLWRASWLMALGFVLANSIVYTVHYRTEMTEAKGLKIETHERARQIEALAAAELNGLRTNPRWEATSGCSNVTATRSRQYCEQVRGVQARLQSAGAILSQGRPASKDAGSETLAWVLSADEEKVRRSLPIFWAVILELIASLCMREAFASFRPDRAQAGLQPAKSRGEDRVKPAASYREPAFAEAPLLGIVAPFNFQREPFPQRGAMNDNMPLAAYA